MVSPQELLDRLQEIHLEAKDVGDDGARARDLRKRLQALHEATPSSWAEGEVLAAFGRAWGDLGDYEAAVSMYTAALDSSEAPFRAAEQLANLQSRQAPKLAAANKPREALRLLRTAIRSLEHQVALSASVERLSMLGAAHKRQAQIAARKQEKQQALKKALNAYSQAAKTAAASGGASDFYYPALNQVAFLILLGRREGVEALIEQAVVSARELEARSPKIWQRFAEADAELYRMLLSAKPDPGSVVNTYRRVFASGAGASPRERASVIEHLDFMAAHAEGEDLKGRLEAVRDGLSKAQ
jgi:tetratricopeptide (TPR) repeat protein